MKDFIKITNTQGFEFILRKDRIIRTGTIDNDNGYIMYSKEGLDDQTGTNISITNAEHVRIVKELTGLVLNIKKID